MASVNAITIWRVLLMVEPLEGAAAAAGGVVSTSYVKVSEARGFPALSAASMVSVLPLPPFHEVFGRTVSVSLSLFVADHMPPSLSAAMSPLSASEAADILSLNVRTIGMLPPIVDPLPGSTVAVGGVLSVGGALPPPPPPQAARVSTTPVRITIEIHFL